jgi:aspartyl-tRNA(Asn)/glutamyl-tRNA(Gln) amidotransferase subunit A
MAPAMQDQRLYQAGAALEAALSSQWGGNLITKAPALTGGK